jgi:hypothetical protein
MQQPKKTHFPGRLFFALPQHGSGAVICFSSMYMPNPSFSLFLSHAIIWPVN